VADADRDAGRSAGKDFIRTIIDRHVAEGRYDEIVTRFPPEPNGYLHIGHAKAICLDFGLAREYGGRCHLRFDDTNPLTEEEEYTASIQRDVRWLGFDWGEHLFFASDYFERMYEVAEQLIRKGRAYVDSSTEDEIREARGTVTEPGRPSAYRDRSVDESLDLFRRMRAGEFPDGAHVLRGRIDLAHPNMIMRDPVFYRIRHAHHYRSGDRWCIYPLYDFAHCLEDAFEGVTHSLCTLEFDNNRAIYDWILDEAGFEEPRTHQYEFARLALEYTVLSKRRLIRLVKEGHVWGWDDPRLPTLAGLRRRGVPAEAIRRFCDMVGVAKANSTVDLGKLDYAVRDLLNTEAPRAFAVLRPLAVVLTNWPAGRQEMLSAPNFPDAGSTGGMRDLRMGRRLFIERDDFAVDPPPGWKRLSPGGEVRLRHAYVIRCDEVVGDPETGEPVELRCTYDANTLGTQPEGRKVAGALHWVAELDARPAEIRLYDRLFSVANPEDVPEGGDFVDNLNPDSLVVLSDALVEPALAAPDAPGRVQLERLGYFARDPDSTAELPVWNRVVTLRDTWSRRADAPREDTRDEVARPRAPQVPEDRISDARRAARDGDGELGARFARYQDELALPLEDADVLTGSRALSDFFEAALEAHPAPGAVAAWVVNDVGAALKERELEQLGFGGRDLGRLVALVEAGTVSRRVAKNVLAEMVERGGDPEAIVRREGLEKQDDPEALRPVVDAVLADWPDKVEAYRAGNANLIGLFMGQVMQRTDGRADPALARSLLLDALGG
jgi:glutaminyl-tRNA synthetase